MSLRVASLAPARAAVVAASAATARTATRRSGSVLSSKCVTCHQITGRYEGIPPIVGWPKPVFIEIMGEYRAQKRPIRHLQTIAVRLTEGEIAALAAIGSLKRGQLSDKRTGRTHEVIQSPRVLNSSGRAHRGKRPAGAGAGASQAQAGGRRRRSGRRHGKIRGEGFQRRGRGHVVEPLRQFITCFHSNLYLADSEAGSRCSIPMTRRRRNTA